MDFVNRIKKKFPEAHILMSSDKPNDKQRETHDKIISITTLKSPSYSERCTLLSQWDHKDVKSELWTQRGKELQVSAKNKFNVPEAVRKHRDNNDIQVFS